MGERLPQYNKQKTLLLAFCVLFFESLNYPFIKMALDGSSPFLFLSIRFWLLALIFMPFTKIKNVQIRPLFQFALIFNVAHYGFNYLSFNYISPTTIGLFQYLQVPFLWMMIHKKNIALFSTILCMILLIQDLNYTSLIGCTLAIFSCLSWALGQMTQKKEEYTVSTFVFFTSILSAPFLTVLSVLTQENFNLGTIHPERMFLLLIYQIGVLGVCKGIWANLSYKEGRSIHTTFIWILKPVCVAILSCLLCVK
ncbi:MAG: EamA family transporter [Pseudomonadota bacterium]|nr:EamA family transporter [Pseudomonadota bacterium]